MASKEPEYVCIAQDPATQKWVERSLKAAGRELSAVYESVAEAQANQSGPMLIYLGAQAPRGSGEMGGLSQLVRNGSKLIVLGESLSNDDFVESLQMAPVNHVIESEECDDINLQVTSQKLATGDIFGLEKYLESEAEIHESMVISYSDKKSSIETIAEFASESRARRSVIQRIETVADELLMNAIYDAPQSANESTPKSARLQYGYDSRYLGIAVTDFYGQLSKELILENFLRAKQSGGQPRLVSQGGAGLGIYFVLSSVSRYIANIHAGEKTEIICLFDRRRPIREWPRCTRSLHVFTEAA